MVRTSAQAAMHGFYEQISMSGAIEALPIIFRELSLGIRLIVKGCKPSLFPDPRYGVPRVRMTEA